MKNKLFALIFLSITLTGCSLFFPLNTQLDEFKHTKKVTLEIATLPQEHFSTSGLSTNITFEKCVSEKGETLTAYFVLNRNSSSFKIEKTCFIKAFGKSFEMVIENQETVNRSQLVSMTQSSSVKDSTKVKTESKTMSNSYDYYEEKFVIHFTPEMVESIKMTNELILRFYLGPKQATFGIKGIQLNRLKKMLSI
jgi:hypothetical protein